MGPVHAQVAGKRKPGRGKPGRRWGDGIGKAARKSRWMRVRLCGLDVRRGPSDAHAIDPQYEKRSWWPVKIDISVKVEGEKAQVQATVGTSHKLSWSGSIKTIGTFSLGGTSPGVGYGSAGVAVRSVRLIPRDSTVTYAYEDRAPEISASRK